MRRSTIPLVATLPFVLLPLLAAQPAVETTDGVVFEVETTLTRLIRLGDFDFRMVRVAAVEDVTESREATGTDLSQLPRATGTFQFKAAPEVWEATLAPGITVAVRADCDGLGNGREVKAQARIQGDRGWVDGTARFSRIDVFERVCR